jgi:hypothetical protein
MVSHQRPPEPPLACRKSREVPLKSFKDILLPKVVNCNGAAPSCLRCLRCGHVLCSAKVHCAQQLIVLQLRILSRLYISYKRIRDDCPSIFLVISGRSPVFPPVTNMSEACSWASTIRTLLALLVMIRISLIYFYQCAALSPTEY